MDRFTTSTGTRLSRSLVNALRGRPYLARGPLNGAIGDGCRELRVAGWDDQAILEFFGSLVEATGRACGADRPSLMSGELQWTPVRVRVLEVVNETLRAPDHSLLLAMDHPNGSR